jgi:transposase-like protein
MTESDIHCIIGEYKAGKTLQWIADANGVSKQRIDKILRQHKVERRERRKVSDETKEKIKSLAVQEKTYTEISELTGVSRSAVCVTVKEAGIERKGKPYKCSKCGGSDYRLNGAKGKVCKPCSATRAREYYKAHHEDAYSKKDERNVTKHDS